MSDWASLLGLQGSSVLLIGVLASVGVGFSTGLGALPVFAVRDLSKSLQMAMLGFAAGVMLAATSFSLILPAIEHGGGGAAAFVPVAVGMAVGAAVIDLVDRYAPHKHFVAGREGRWSASLSGIWLFVIAIAIHNFPEGLAVGVSFGGGDVANGLSVATAIGLQNLPEGFAVAVALLREQYSTWRAFLIALATGAIEIVGGLLGLAVVQAVDVLLPYALAFAAGAMLFVISDEIIPETHRDGGQRIATYAVVLGFVVMAFLDNLFE